MKRDVITKAEEGKRVIDIDGAMVGYIVAVDNGWGYVRRARSVTDAIRSKLGLPRDLSMAHPLDEGSIERITDDAVHLRGRF